MVTSDSFQDLFESGYPLIRRYALHRGMSGPDADELVAETFEIAWRRLDEVPDTAALPWLYGVAHNVWRNRMRSDRRRTALLVRIRTLSPSSSSAEPVGAAAGDAEDALSSLSPTDQELLRLIAWDGLSPAEAAMAIGCSPAALPTRLRRARNRLASELGLDRVPTRSAFGRQPGRQPAIAMPLAPSTAAELATRFEKEHDHG